MKWNRVGATFFYSLAGLMTFLLITLGQNSFEFEDLSKPSGWVSLWPTLSISLSIPIFYRIGKLFRNREAKKLARDILEGQALKKPLVLNLRPFFADRHTYRNEVRSWSARLNIFRLMDPRHGLEDQIERALNSKADLIKLGGDRTDTAGSTLKTNPSGIRRHLSRKADARFDHANWPELALLMAEKATIILMVPLVRENSATDWELSQIVKNQWIEKLVFVMPPKGKVRFDDGERTTMEEAWAESRHAIRNKYGLDLPRYHRSGALVMREQATGQLKALTFASAVQWNRKHALKQFLLFGRGRSSTYRELLRIGCRFTLMFCLLPALSSLFLYQVIFEIAKLEKHNGALALSAAALSFTACYFMSTAFASRFSENRSIGENALKVVLLAATISLASLALLLANAGERSWFDWVEWLSGAGNTALLCATVAGLLWSGGLTLAFYAVMAHHRVDSAVEPHL